MTQFFGDTIGQFDTINEVTPNAGVTIDGLLLKDGKVNGLTVTATTGIFTLASAKTLTVNNTLTFSGTDSSSVAFGAGGTVVYTSNNLSVFASTTSLQLKTLISDETGSGSLVFATSPTFVTPVLGVAAGTSLTLTEAVGASGLVVTGATQTSNFPVISATQTWNASGTTFTGFLLNITNTASGANSLIADFQIGGTSKTSIRKDGSILTTFTGTQLNFQSGSQLFSSTNGSSFWQTGFSGKTYQWKNSSAAVIITINQDNGFLCLGKTSSPTAVLELAAGTATAGTGPLKFTSGTNLTTAEAGVMEYNGTNLLFTRAGTTRENVLVAVDNVAAPTVTPGVVIVGYYGSAATNFLGDPNRWASVNILGSVYKIPLYN